MKRHNTAPIKSYAGSPDPKKVILPKMVTVPKPTLGNQSNNTNTNNGSLNGIKKINLGTINKLTPPNTSKTLVTSTRNGLVNNKDNEQTKTTKTIHFSSINEFASNATKLTTKIIKNNEKKVDIEAKKEKESATKEVAVKDANEDVDIEMNDPSKDSVHEKEKSDKDEIKNKSKDKDKEKEKSKSKSKDKDRKDKKRRSRDRDRS